MKPEFSQYNCKEFFEKYYANGLFHPTEAQELLPHREIKIDSKNQLIQIGRIYDDHDLILCFRKGLKGIYSHSNYDGSFHFFSETLKEFTEGWYQKESNYWSGLTKNTMWKEIEQFYIINEARYDWKTIRMLSFIKRGLRTNISNELFIKGYKNQLGISLKNGFAGRPFENMVNLVVDESLENYTSHFQLSFFDEKNSEKYEIDELDEMINDIRKWIIKSV